MSGFGSGLIISAAMAPVVGVEAVVPVISVVMLITNASRVWIYFASLDLRRAGILLTTSIPASIVGAYFYVNLDVGLVSVLLGAVLLAAIPLNRYLRGRKLTMGNPMLAGTGLVFGFLTSNIVGAGVLLPPILLGVGLTGTAVIATDAALAVGTSLFKVIAFGALDALTLQLTLAGALMGLCTVPGTWVAGWVIRNTHARIHTAVIEFFIVVAAVMFLYEGLAG